MFYDRWPWEFLYPNAAKVACCRTSESWPLTEAADNAKKTTQRLKMRSKLNPIHKKQ
jgi:hypothetical protein